MTTHRDSTHRLLLMLASMAVVATALLVGATAGAGELYRYVTEDGTVAFTDEAKRVPERYRAGAEKRTTQGLDDFGRYTPTDAAAHADYATRLAARLERLERLNAELYAEPVVAAPRASGPEATRVVVRAGEESRPSIEVTTPQGGEALPIVTERKRLLDEETGFTRHVTIVRQGDKVLAVVKPRNHFEPPFWDTIQNLEEGKGRKLGQ